MVVAVAWNVVERDETLGLALITKHWLESQVQINSEVQSHAILLLEWDAVSTPDSKLKLIVSHVSHVDVDVSRLRGTGMSTSVSDFYHHYLPTLWQFVLQT